MKLKKITALMLASATALSMVACGSGSSGNNGSSETESGEANANSGEFTVSELTVDIWDNNQLEGLQTIADKWTETSGVKVNINVVDWDNYWTLLSAGADGGEMPDVFWMHSSVSRIYMENDLLLNLDPYIEADDTIDLDNYYGDIVDLYTRDDGVHFAVPKDHDTIALLYNKALFEQYGVDYPTDDWSWNDLYNAAKQITEAGKDDDVYGYALDTSDYQDGWYNLIYGYGGEVITEDHTGTTIGGDESKAGMEMMRQILTVSTPQTTVAETGCESLFVSGKVAMTTQGSWMINYFYQTETRDDYEWVMIPYSDANGNGVCDDGERVSSYNGLGWAAAYNTPDPDAAYSLISYFCSEEGQIEQAKLGVTMAGMPGLSEEFSSAFEGMDVSAFLRVEEEGQLYFYPCTRNTTVWETPIQQAGAFLDAWQNPDDPDAMAAACENAQKIIEDAIAAE